MTDTINTLADPGSDPADEWQQPAFTPDEYRTAAKVIAASQQCAGFPYATGAGVKWLNDEAARLEAESARDEEAERYAEVYRSARCDEHPILLPWSRLPAIDRKEEARVMRGFLDQLAADGRLLPEGGTVLTAEQWAMVQTLIEASHRKPEAQRAADRLRDEFKVGRCRCGGLIAEPSPGCEWHSAREVTPPAASVLDSGPDGTPEKPWPTWQDVPEGVKVRGTGMDGSISKKGDEVTHWHPNGAYCCLNPLAFTRRAPFVRVDGGKA